MLFPGRDGGADLTKRDLIRYLAVTAPAMVPYLHGRALNLHRFPDGVNKAGFWHKAVPSHAPEWLGRWRYERADPGETQWYLTADDAPALAWLANYGAVEIHPWTSSTERPDEPGWALVDIDPGRETSFDDVLVLARLHRTALEHLGVTGGAKVSGQRGIQIYIPVAPGYRFDEHPPMGGGAVASHRRHRARDGELAMAEGRAERKGSAGLHAERSEQDPGRAVQSPRRAGRAGVGADHMGRARRPVAATGRLDHRNRGAALGR